ncbi:MAG: hypothetical protein DI586_04475 [Micavibrio aeruginosavorus]|uniref:PH domain-containing protein n=1 Tax=Micavibrio aeruginosavorus TaxID=349221 RepID=A0A2W5FJH3_9BACT|nr:MAG: hypothetical protein DI586_04475 [Micavibrio aeruginosavorus]
MKTKSPPRLEARLSQGRLVLHATWTALFSAGGAYTMACSDNQKHIFIGFLAFAFFGFCMAVFLKKLFDKKIYLLVDENGFYWKPIKDAYIPWEEIADIKEMAVSNHKLLKLVLINFEYLGWTGWKKTMYQVTQGGNLTFTAGILDRKHEEIKEAVDYYLTNRPAPQGEF